MPELTDLSYVRALCEKYDFALSKGFGQNFIVNPGLPPKIVDASGVDKRYGVLEIGPGIGVLTRELAKRAAKVSPMAAVSGSTQNVPVGRAAHAGKGRACRPCWPRPWPVWTISSWYCRMCSRWT